MFFLNRFYFYSSYIKKVLISSILVFLFSYSFYSVGESRKARRGNSVAKKAADAKVEAAVADAKVAVADAKVAEKAVDVAKDKEAKAVAAAVEAKKALDIAKKARAKAQTSRVAKKAAAVKLVKIDIKDTAPIVVKTIAIGGLIYLTSTYLAANGVVVALAKITKAAVNNYFVKTAIAKKALTKVVTAKKVAKTVFNSAITTATPIH